MKSNKILCYAMWFLTITKILCSMENTKLDKNTTNLDLMHKTYNPGLERGQNLSCYFNSSLQCFYQIWPLTSKILLTDPFIKWKQIDASINQEIKETEKEISTFNKIKNNMNKDANFLQKKNNQLNWFKNQSIFWMYAAFLREISEIKCDPQITKINLNRNLYHMGITLQNFFSKTANVFFKSQNIQDADEFLNLFIDCLEQFSKEIEKCIHHNICGKIGTQIICQGPNHPKNDVSKISDERFYKLNVPIQKENSKNKSQPEDMKKLEECLDEFCSNEELSGDNKFYCESCRQKTTATKKFIITKLSKFLIISLKRFKKNFYRNTFSKISNQVECPIFLEIDLNNTNFNLRDYPNELRKYKLRSFISHKGSLFEGHYVSYVLYDKNDKNEDWYKFDDSTRRKAEGEEIITGKKSDTNFTPYILFYEHTNPEALEKQQKKDLTLEFQKILNDGGDDFQRWKFLSEDEKDEYKKFLLEKLQKEDYIQEKENGMPYIVEKQKINYESNFSQLQQKEDKKKSITEKITNQESTTESLFKQALQKLTKKLTELKNSLLGKNH
jgi:ubiquitin C-terminal hydrolase